MDMLYIMCPERFVASYSISFKTYDAGGCYYFFCTYLTNYNLSTEKRDLYCKFNSWFACSNGEIKEHIHWCLKLAKHFNINHILLWISWNNIYQIATCIKWTFISTVKATISIIFCFKAHNNWRRGK